MFKAIGRYFRAVGYFLTGRVDQASRSLSTDPNVVTATYANVIDEKKKSIRQYKDAIARMIAQEEKKLSRLKDLTDEVGKLEQLKEGAAAKARSLVANLKAEGTSLAAIQQQPEYVRCQSAFNDFSSSLEEKSGHIAELEEDLKQLNDSIANHKVQLQDLMREIPKLEQESAETAADIITAREEEQIADMLSGISTDRTSQELANMRQLRQEQKAKARISRELASTDAKAQENEFMAYAQQSSANDEFAKLIGLAGETDSADNAAAPEQSDDADKPQRDTRLPEG